MLMLEQLVTAGETWKDQLDIEKLLKTPRRTNRDRIYTVNDKYGFGRSLKLYAGIPDQDSIHGIVPHGADAYGDLTGEAEAPKQELIDRIPCIFTSSDRCFNAFWNAGKRHLFPIGLASIYTHECIKREKRTCQGSLFFRSHSTPAVINSLDDEQAINWLKSLPKRFHPINISVFPFDYHRGVYRQYKESGFRLVCAGTEYDEDFIWRHLHLIKSHKYILSTGMGTHIFHSVICGRPTLVRKSDEKYTAKHRDFQKRISQVGRYLQLANYFTQEVEEPNKKQIDLANEFLGTKYLANPETLRRFMELAKQIHERSQN